jgi:hypothetical protein
MMNITRLQIGSTMNYKMVELDMMHPLNFREIIFYITSKSKKDGIQMQSFL